LMNYFAELFGYDKQEQKRRTENLLTRVGLEEKSWDKQLRKFSKGMSQRVGIAQSLINDPEIVFFDEPMSGLDPLGRREIRELISDLRNSGTTVFMSTHILSDIEALCDNVAILRGGKLAATGKLTELLFNAGEAQSFEIVVKGADYEQLKNSFVQSSVSNLSFNANGVNITVTDENEIVTIIETAQKFGGKLVSVQPLRQSLEELFVKETK